MSARPLVPDILLQNPTTRAVAVLAYPGVEVLDVTGPFEAFAFASLLLQQRGLIKEPVYRLEILAEQPGPITTFSGLQLVATKSYHAIDDSIDTLLIPGAADFKDITRVLQTPSLLQWISDKFPQIRRLASVCTGAFLLAECGLLDNRCATTHWLFSEQFASHYPAVKLEFDRIFIRDGSLYTSGGVTSGIDLALAMIEEDWGRELALSVARLLVVFLKRPGGQAQFSAYLTSEAPNRADIQELQAWIIANPAADLHVEALAERMAMSPRNFARMFQAETGTTPAKFVELARIDAARHYLGHDDLSIEKVADKSGFGDTERMRRAFLRHLGVNPVDYRARFNPYAKQGGAVPGSLFMLNA